MRVESVGLGFADVTTTDPGNNTIFIDPNAGTDPSTDPNWSTPVGTTYNGLPSNPGDSSLPSSGSPALTAILSTITGIFRGATTPQLPTGSSLVVGSDGKTYIRTSSGQQYLYTASGTVSGNMGAWIIGGIALVVVMSMAKR